MLGHRLVQAAPDARLTALSARCNASAGSRSLRKRSMAATALWAAPTASITVAGPLTMSPAAKT
ncbi:MAG: hypothetical protein U5R30_19480 [Deltaproteobacteria bacterium]|nr:hypothetical protein [Deltaproteobacteria bacterium]